MCHPQTTPRLLTNLLTWFLPDRWPMREGYLYKYKTINCICSRGSPYPHDDSGFIGKSWFWLHGPCLPGDGTTEAVIGVFILFHWHIVDLQCCVNFCCTAKWFRYTCTHISLNHFAVQQKLTQHCKYIYILFHILCRYGLSQDIEYSSLCYTVGPCCLCDMIFYLEVMQIDQHILKKYS